MQLILHLVWESQLLKMDFLHYVLLCLWLFVKDNAAALMDLFIYLYSKYPFNLTMPGW